MEIDIFFTGLIAMWVPAVDLGLSIVLARTLSRLIKIMIAAY